MKFSWINLGAFILTFLLTVAILVISIMLGMGFAGFPRHLNHPLLFILLGSLTFLSLKLTENRMSARYVIIAIVLAWFLVFIPKSLSSRFTFALNTLTFYITIISAVLAGYYFNKNKDFKVLALLFVLPLSLYFGVEKNWQSFVTTFDETDLTVYDVPAFSFSTKEGSLIDNTSQNGKITVLDFWFIGCAPCWSKFPELQSLYDQHKDNQNVEIYAVNRPMRQDGRDELFTSIEEEGYSFPVGRGTQELMDTLGIYTYPTVMVINSEGMIVYKGSHSGAKETIEKVLKD